MMWPCCFELTIEIHTDYWPLTIDVRPTEKFKSERRGTHRYWFGDSGTPWCGPLISPWTGEMQSVCTGCCTNWTWQSTEWLGIDAHTILVGRPWCPGHALLFTHQGTLQASIVIVEFKKYIHTHLSVAFLFCKVNHGTRGPGERSKKSSTKNHLVKDGGPTSRGKF